MNREEINKKRDQLKLKIEHDDLCIESNFVKGFDAAVDLLLPENQKLTEENKSLLFRLDWATTTTELVEAHDKITALQAEIESLKTENIFSWKSISETNAKKVEQLEKENVELKVFCDNAQSAEHQWRKKYFSQAAIIEKFEAALIKIQEDFEPTNESEFGLALSEVKDHAHLTLAEVAKLKGEE